MAGREVRAALLALTLLLPTVAAAQIPLDQVTVVGSPGRVLSFRPAASIDRLALVPGALHLEVSHQTAWPAVSIDGGEPVQAATLWVFLQIGGRWYAAGAERLRPGQIAGDDKPEDANVNNFIGVSWLYDSGRWGPMAGYTPRAGELVGMMVAAGSSRSDDQAPVQERTKVVAFAWPGAGGSADIRPVWTEGDATSAPSPPAPTPSPVPPVVGQSGPAGPPGPQGPPGPSVDVSAILSRLDKLEARVATVEARKVPVTCSAAANLGFTRIPVSCRLD